MPKLYEDNDFDEDDGDYDVLSPKELKHKWHQGAPISYNDDDDNYYDDDDD